LKTITEILSFLLPLVFEFKKNGMRHTDRQRDEHYWKNP